MSSFLRFAGAAAIVLSFGLFVRALPVTLDVHVPAIIGTDGVSLVCAKLFVDIEAKIRALLACATLAELQVAVTVLVALLKACGDELLKVGAGVDVDVEAKANIVACVAAIITLLVKVCVQLSVKFGVTVVAALFVEIDVCLRLILVNLNICIGGILGLIVDAMTSVNIKVYLKLCAGLLSSVNL